MEKRNTSLDLLRIAATFSVIIIHINAYYMGNRIGITNSINIIQNILNILLRFSVPCFVMISGAFILKNPKNRNFKYYYAKTFYKLGIPLILTLLFLLCVSEISRIFGSHDYFSPIKSILLGDYYNLWYMFMIMGIYFLVPFLIRIKEILPSKIYLILSIVWLLLGVINQTTCQYNISYSFGNIFSFLGYFLIGDILYSKFKNRLNKKTIILMILSIILLTAVTFMFRWKTGIMLYDFNPYRSFFSPSIVLISICVFVIFLNLNVKRDLSKLSNKTYYIYLIHTFCYVMIFSIIKTRLFINIVVTILLVSLLTFAISWLVSTLYLNLWNQVEEKFNLREKYNSLIFKK